MLNCTFNGSVYHGVYNKAQPDFLEIVMFTQTWQCIVI